FPYTTLFRSLHGRVPGGVIVRPLLISLRGTGEHPPPDDRQDRPDDLGPVFLRPRPQIKREPRPLMRSRHLRVDRDPVAPAREVAPDLRIVRGDRPQSVIRDRSLSGLTEKTITEVSRREKALELRRPDLAPDVVEGHDRCRRPGENREHALTELTVIVRPTRPDHATVNCPDDRREVRLPRAGRRRV